jgi:hypothetical protein
LEKRQGATSARGALCAFYTSQAQPKRNNPLSTTAELKFPSAERKKLIPEISLEEVAEMLKTIRPLVRKSTIRTLEDGGFEIDWDKPLHNIETPDPFTSFVWDPKYLDKVDENSLIRLTILRTYHTTGYHGLCKPSTAEVLAQIPVDMRPIVTRLRGGN